MTTHTQQTEDRPTATADRAGEIKFRYWRDDEPAGFTYATSLDRALAIVGAKLIRADMDRRAALVLHLGRLLAVTW